MRIDVYEILSTNSLAGSRIIINDNFRMLQDGINKLYQNISVDDEDKMRITDIEELTGNNITVDVLNASNYSNGRKVCMKIDETTGHLIILDSNGDLKLDVNSALQYIN